MLATFCLIYTAKRYILIPNAINCCRDTSVKIYMTTPHHELGGQQRRAPAFIFSAFNGLSINA